MSATNRSHKIALRFRRQRPEGRFAPDVNGMVQAKPPSLESAVAAAETLGRLQNLEGQLVQLTARMKVIMDNIPAGVVLLKPIEGEAPDFLITAVNINVNTVAGFDEPLLYEGGRLATCLRPAARQGMYGECEIDRRIAERMAWYASQPDRTIWSIFPSVGGRFVKATRSPLGDFGYVVVTVDTTDQVKTEMALAMKSGQFDLMLDNMPEGVIMFAPDLTVAAHSRRVNAMLGVPDECIQVGRSLEACLRKVAQSGMYAHRTSDLEDLVKQRVAWYTSDQDSTISTVQEITGGRYLKFTRSPVGNNGMIVLFVDITEQMLTESALKAARDRAETALEDLLLAQNRLVQAETLASLGRMVAGVAHEINTPIGVSVTLASLIGERVRDLERDLDAGRLRRADLKRYITETEDACSLMLGTLRRGADLVSSFKQVAADQASEERRTFELGALVNDIIVSLGPVWRKAGHHVKIICQNEIHIDGYPGIFSKILTNLLTNSIVHGFEQGQFGLITININLLSAGIVEICYTDTGKGICPEVRDKVFDPFFTTRRGLGSTGLSLHIIHNLVTGKLGGSIDLETEEGQGVRFLIRFPGLRQTSPIGME